MNLKLEIRRNSDGVVATTVWPNWEWNAFWWEDGNAACDCNREDFFRQANGDDEIDDAPCGDDRYDVRLSDADTGAVLLDEFDQRAQSTPQPPAPSADHP